MKRLFLALLLALTISGFGLAAPSAHPAAAANMQECPLTPTISSLRDCVAHAVSEGLINDQGVATALFSLLDAAQTALDRGQTTAAINILQAFINLVQAQAGVHIDAMHAQHMILHAQAVIQALQ